MYPLYLSVNHNANYGARYIILNPVIRVLTKSPASALETVLHALFLPTPFKLAQSDAVERQSTNEHGTATPGPRRTPDEIEVLKPGALTVRLSLFLLMAT